MITSDRNRLTAPQLQDNIKCPPLFAAGRSRLVETKRTIRSAFYTYIPYILLWTQPGIKELVVTNISIAAQRIPARLELQILFPCYFQKTMLYTTY